MKDLVELTILAGMLVAFTTLLGPAVARAETDSVTVTIYNQNRALVNEVRQMAVPKGTHLIEFREVAETIDATSLQVRSLTSPESFRILDQNYEYDLISVQNLLNKYVGKTLKILIPDARGVEGARIVKDARLLANNDKPIFQIIEGEGTVSSGPPGTPSGGGEIYVGDFEAVLLPEIPEGLRPQPTLVWLVDNQGAEEQRIEASYLAGGMSWKADYVLKVDRDNSKGALSGWVTLENSSGKAFKNARLKLVAGDVHVVHRPSRQAEGLERKMMAQAVPPEDMAEEELFEYHLYSLGRNVDILNRQTKQVALLQSPAVKIEKRVIGSWSNWHYDSGQRDTIKQKLDVFLKFKNNEPNGLGLPLPEGVVRAYQESGDGTVIFIGEDTIDHTGKDNDVELKMGQAFDIVVERRQTEYRKIGANGVRFTWEIRIKNSKDTPQRVELQETFSGEWKVLASNTKLEKMDARRIKFIVDAAPSGKGPDTIVTYEVEVNR